MNIKTDITNPQRLFIQGIENNLQLIGFDVRFDGTTRREASAFIDKYGNYCRDVDRICRGQLPYWSMIVNQPPKDPQIHAYMLTAKMEMEEHPYSLEVERYGLHEMDFHSWGDDWG